MPLNGKQMEKLLLKNGFHKVRTKGSHNFYTKDGFPNIPVQIHGSKDIPKGTEQNILKMAGLKK